LSASWRLASRRRALQARAAILWAIRRFFLERDFLEVETPHRIPAPAPESHIDAVPAAGWFLHTSPELCMKRLLAAGHQRIFQVCRCWRQSERGQLHVPEFTLLEWYRAGSNYRDLMEDCQALIQHVAQAVGKGDELVYQGQSVHLRGQWPRMTVQEAFELYSESSVTTAIEQNQFDEIMVRDVEPHLSGTRPVFLSDYPAERGSLARLRADDATVAERVELYIAGLELANGFTELTDPVEQRTRFVREEANRRSMGKQAHPLPERFLEELEDVPPAAGMALGVDRLVMLLVDAASIDDVVAFTPEDL
jgi:lysyl-tRNA synthetase class 2